MAAEQDPAGAVSHNPDGWYEQDFRKAEKGSVSAASAYRSGYATGVHCGETASFTGR